MDFQSPHLLVGHVTNRLEVEAGPQVLGTEAQSWQHGKVHFSNCKGSFKLPLVLGRLLEAMGNTAVQNCLRETEYHNFYHSPTVFLLLTH